MTQKQARDLLQTRPRVMKEALLAEFKPQNYRGDVWLLTERDAGARIDGSANDLFVLKLSEHSNGGYLWNLDQLRDSGFVVVGNAVEDQAEERVGEPGIRRITAQPPDEFRGRMIIDEARPWDLEQRRRRLEIDLDFTGPEQAGLSRAERRQRLEAA